MTIRKSKEQLEGEFRFAIECIEQCGKRAARTENLHYLSTQLGYVDASLAGGKLTSKEASLRVKDLYKAWKDTNKAIDLE